MISRTRTSFWRVWTAQVVSVVGDGMHRAALLWWAVSTRSTGAAVVLTLASTVPVVVCSPIGGALADRLPRRSLMVRADLLRIVTSASLALAVTSGAPLAVVAVGTAVAAVGEAAFAPAYRASLAQLLPEDERATGNALDLANGAAGGLLGATLGGAGVAIVGVGGVLVADAVTFAVSAALIASATIRPPQPSVDPPGTPSMGGGRAAGWRLVTGDLEVRRLALLGAVLNLFTAPAAVLVVAFVVERLRGGSTVYGALEACISGGLVVGAVAAPGLGRRLGAGRALTAGLLGLGTATAAVALTRHAAVTGAALIAVGVGAAVANTFWLGRMQSVVAEEAQGRVFGVVGGVVMGLRPLGLAAAGPLVGRVGPAAGFALCGLGIVGATLGLRAPGRLRVGQAGGTGQVGEHP